MRVYLNETLCPEFLGVNAVYHGFCYMPFQTERGMTEADAIRELDRVAEIGLRLNEPGAEVRFASATACTGTYIEELVTPGPAAAPEWRFAEDRFQ